MISFEHDGVRIFNPFLSPCGRFSVSPNTYYGFEQWSNGKKGEVFVKQLPDGSSVKIEERTQDGGPFSAENSVLVLESAGGQRIASHPVPSELEVEDAKKRRFVAAWGVSFGRKKPLIVDIDWFSMANGYRPGEIAAIERLAPGETWQSEVYTDHVVRRLRPYEMAFPEYGDSLPDLKPMIDISSPARGMPEFSLRINGREALLQCGFSSGIPGKEDPQRFLLTRIDPETGQKIGVIASAATLEALAEACIHLLSTECPPNASLGDIAALLTKEFDA